MIRHTVLFKWKPDFPAPEKAAWIAGLDRMDGNIPGLVRLTHGPDIFQHDHSFDYAIVADFDAAEDLEAYNSHPLHEPLKQYSFPNSETIIAVDFHLSRQHGAFKGE